MATRAVTVGAASGTAGISGEAGLAGVPRLLEDLARLSEDKDTADIVFLLGRDETPVYAHRIILQARSVSFIGRFSWYASINLVFLAHNIPVDPGKHVKLVEIQTMRQFTLSSFPSSIFFHRLQGWGEQVRLVPVNEASEVGNFITASTMHLGTKLIVNRNFY